MSTTDLLIIQTSTLAVLYYKFNYQVYVKKWIGIKGFRKVKPIDCYSCTNFWLSLASFTIYPPLTAIKYIGLTTLAAILIETNIER